MIAGAIGARLARRHRGARVAVDSGIMSQLQRCYDYVNQPYEIVRREVLADPASLFSKATSAAQATRLHVPSGALEFGAEVEIEICAIDQKHEPHQSPTTTIAIEWRAKRRPTLFPVMTANIAIYPLTPTETHVELSGSYAPPLGMLRETVDALALHRLAESSAQNFVRELATHLRRTLRRNQVSA
jgi:hypothetical protein